MKERKNTRLKPYNYSLGGFYFLTICTKDHEEILGSVSNNRVILNKLGRIVQQNLLMIKKIYADADIDDYYVIMPNHLHFILIVDRTIGEDENRSKMYASKIVQQFKSACTKEIRKELNKRITVWQRSFYDRIIRSEKEFYNIRRYIELNPMKWDLEKSIPENLDL